MTPSMAPGLGPHTYRKRIAALEKAVTRMMAQLEVAERKLARKDAYIARLREHARRLGRHKARRAGALASKQARQVEIERLRRQNRAMWERVATL
jgi:predicted RNase H-like nuclease (RuvC/YqgF family)